MEAATPLHSPRIHVLANAVIVERLAVHDERAVALVRARSESGEDVPALISEAIEIGARVLDREKAGAAVEVLKQDLEHASQAVVTELKTQLEQAFGPDSGHVTRVLERHFGAESSSAVQHQVRAAVAT